MVLEALRLISSGQAPLIAGRDARTGRTVHANDLPYTSNYNVAGYNLLVRGNKAYFAGAFSIKFPFENGEDAVIHNNELTNASDTDRYDNPQADQRAGLEESLKFDCGVHGEFSVDGWKARLLK